MQEEQQKQEMFNFPLTDDQEDPIHIIPDSQITKQLNPSSATISQLPLPPILQINIDTLPITQIDLQSLYSIKSYNPSTWFFRDPTSIHTFVFGHHQNKIPIKVLQESHASHKPQNIPYEVSQQSYNFLGSYSLLNEYQGFNMLGYAAVIPLCPDLWVLARFINQMNKQYLLDRKKRPFFSAPFVNNINNNISDSFLYQTEIISFFNHKQNLSTEVTYFNKRNKKLFIKQKMMPYKNELIKGQQWLVFRDSHFKKQLNANEQNQPDNLIDEIPLVQIVDFDAKLEIYDMKARKVVLEYQVLKDFGSRIDADSYKEYKGTFTKFKVLPGQFEHLNQNKQIDQINKIETSDQIETAEEKYNCFYIALVHKKFSEGILLNVYGLRLDVYTNKREIKFDLIQRVSLTSESMYTYEHSEFQDIIIRKNTIMMFLQVTSAFLSDQCDNTQLLCLNFQRIDQKEKGQFLEKQDCMKKVQFPKQSRHVRKTYSGKYFEGEVPYIVVKTTLQQQLQQEQQQGLDVQVNANEDDQTEFLNEISTYSYDSLVFN